MADTNHIVDTVLETTQNYYQLRDEGIAHIEKMSGQSWTNFNPADPGITILDQLCFALTELGYCIDFPMEDILTSKQGKLQLKNQFFKPEDILTSSPITPTDYVKYMVDAVEETKNAQFTPTIAGAYVSYLLTNAKGYRRATSLHNTAYFKLNQSRNVGEQFVMPRLFNQIKVTISGGVEIDNSADANAIADAILVAIRDYVFPFLPQLGYAQMIAEGYSTNEIFNGPKLQNGWIIPGTAKKTTLTAADLLNVILSVDGVKYVSDLQMFKDEHPVDGVILNINEIATFTFAPYALEKGFVIQKNGKKQELTSTTLLHNDIEELNITKSINAAIRMAPKPPEGRFREIESYYSIQNTFPEIFGVGFHAVDQNADDFEIAKSRQLKGYLTLFDQVLANQFSQLANVRHLFSFKNTSSADGQDLYNYHVEEKRTQNKDEYPVPYKEFAPTYFYQSLYNIPQIKPLLKGNEMFHFDVGQLSAKELEEKTWKRYQHDPYNPYIYNVMQLRESDEEALQRRNDMLDHLLARHGMSVTMIDRYIRHSFWTGNSKKDEIITKSLLLQNVEKLSYNLPKAYDFLAADVISSVEMLKIQDFSDKSWTDGLFDIKKNDKRYHLTTKDFTNFSAFEWWINMLFGLDSYYTAVLSDDDTPLNDQKKRQCSWLIQQCKGFVFIENQLLFKAAACQPIMKKNNAYWKCEHIFTFEQVVDFYAQPVIMEKDGNVEVNGILFTPTPVTANLHERNFTQITDGYSLMVKATWKKENTFLNSTTFNNKVEIVFPDYLNRFQEQYYKNDIASAVETFLPAHINAKIAYAPYHKMVEIIQAKVNWHNSLRHGNTPDINAADTLANWIINGDQ